MHRPDRKRFDFPTLLLFAVPVLIIGVLTARQMTLSRHNQALLTAVQLGQDARVKALLDQGAEIEGSDVVGQTPLFYAAASQHLSTVQLLLDRGAKCNVKDQAGMTPLFVAVSENQRRGQNAKADPRIAKLFLDRGADVKIQTPGDTRPLLHWLVEEGDPANVRTALQRGAAINARGADGATPLEIAAMLPKWGTPQAAEVVKILLDSGADPNLLGSGGDPPLLTAVKCGRNGTNLGVIRQLLAHGAKWQLADKGGQTPLKFAEIALEKQAAELLKQAGATH